MGSDSHAAFTGDHCDAKRLPVRIDAIQRASQRLHGVAIRTPLIESLRLNALVEGRVFLKLETLQHGGAFKFRGAFNRLSQLTQQERAAGVVAFSSGNHAVGIATAAALLGIPAVVVVPKDAPRAKVERAREAGAEIHCYDRATESREAIAAGIATERGAVVVPSFDDPHVIAGQGTLALEIASDVRERDVELTALLCPAGGGGLAAGCAIALNQVSPATHLIPVEPEGFDDIHRSLDVGRRVTNIPRSSSCCDALLVQTPGRITFDVLRALVTRSLVVGDHDVRRAVAYAHEELKLVVEPSGAIALAAVLAGHIDCRGKAVAVVLSGGNLDAELLHASLAEAGNTQWL